MLKFYATGTKKTNTTEIDESGKKVKILSNKNIVIDNLPDSRHLAQREAVYVAKREGIVLDGEVRVIQGTQRQGETMTKNARNRRLKEIAKEKANRKKRQAVKV